MRKALKFLHRREVEHHTLSHILDIVGDSIKRLFVPTAIFLAAYLMYRSDPRSGAECVLFAIGLGSLVASGVTFIFFSWWLSMSQLEELNLSPVPKWIAISFQCMNHLYIALAVVVQAFRQLP